MDSPPLPAARDVCTAAGGERIRLQPASLISKGANHKNNYKAGPAQFTNTQSKILPQQCPGECARCYQGRPL